MATKNTTKGVRDIVEILVEKSLICEKCYSTTTVREAEEAIRSEYGIKCGAIKDDGVNVWFWAHL